MGVLNLGAPPSLALRGIDMNRKQREKNRNTAKYLADCIFSDSMPDGLYLIGGKLVHECASCGRDCEWNGTIEDFKHPDAIKVGGCTQWCLP